MSGFVWCADIAQAATKKQTLPKPQLFDALCYRLQTPQVPPALAQ
jgi:hypothetical protein